MSTLPNFSKHVVLYADDDSDDILLIKEAFSKYSDFIEVVTAPDGQEAISILEDLSNIDREPCLIILDINMPKLSGKEALKIIRSIQSFKDTPVLLFTTSSQPTDKDFAAKYNAGFYTKPLDVRQMEGIPDMFLDHCADDVKKKLERRVK